MKNSLINEINSLSPEEINDIMNKADKDFRKVYKINIENNIHEQIKEINEDTRSTFTSV